MRKNLFGKFVVLAIGVVGFLWIEDTLFRLSSMFHSYAKALPILLMLGVLYLFFNLSKQYKSWFYKN